MRILITGAGGMLAGSVRALACARGHEVTALPEEALDITDAVAVARTLADVRPGAVLHCAAYTRVDDAEAEPDRAMAVNATGTLHVARACDAVDACFVYPSTDYVFGGGARRPYSPHSRCAPRSVYGASKLAGEAAALLSSRHLVVRTAWLYGAGGRNFVSTILDRARRGQPLRVVDDQRGSPTWTEDLSAVILGLVEGDAPSGVYHATNSGVATWYDLARAATELAGCPTEIVPVTTAEFPRPAPRPRYSVLDCSSTTAVTGPIPDWRDALRRAIGAGGL